jgi:transposase
LSCIQWLSIVKLFELEVSTRKIASQVGVAYNTAYRAVQTIRYAILAHSGEDDFGLLGGEVELDESYFGGRRKGKRGRGASGKVPVFGILERNGKVKVSVVKDVTARTLLDLTVKTVRRGSIVYTDRFRSYDSLMFCGYRHLKVDHGKRFASGKVYINGLEGFWSWAKERSIKHHGISKKTFPLYLKELEFRYNHRHTDIFDKLTDFLCDLVPKLE